MTTVLSAPVVEADRRAAMLALARVEAGRALRSPVTIVAAVLFLAPSIYGWVAGTATAYPVLHAESVSVQFLALLVFGNASLVTANLAALRAHRHHADALFDVLVLPAAWRTGALLLAVLTPAALAFVLVGVRIAVLALAPHAVGRVLPLDLLIVPASVALFGALGVLLARVTRSAVVAPVVALLLTSCAFVAPVGASSSTSYRLLLPTVAPEFPMPVPAEIFGRPAARHLVYVVGLIGVLAVLALRRSGARVWLAAAVAALVTLGGAVTQFRVDDSLADARRQAIVAPASMQTCRNVGDVRYCAYDDFAPWIDSWDAVLRDVRRATPGVGGPPLVVRQRVLTVGYPTEGTVGTPDGDRRLLDQTRTANVEAGTPEAIPAGTEWGDERSEAVFAAAVAYRLMTGQAWSTGLPVCGARGALLIWLVGQANERVAAGLRDLDATSTGALVFADSSGYLPMAVPDPDAAAGLALLGKPGAERLVREHWTELIARETDADRFAELVGVPAAAQPPAEERTQC